MKYIGLFLLIPLCLYSVGMTPITMVFEGSRLVSIDVKALILCACLCTMWNTVMTRIEKLEAQNKRTQVQAPKQEKER